MAAKLALVLVVVCVVIAVGNSLDYEFNVKSRGKETVDLDVKGRKITISGKDSLYVKSFKIRWAVVKNTKSGECVLKRTWSKWNRKSSSKWRKYYASYVKKTLTFINNTGEDLIETKSCTKLATRRLSKRAQKWTDRYYKGVCSSLKIISYKKAGRTARDLDTMDEEYELEERLMDELRDVQPDKKASSVTVCKRTACSTKKMTYRGCCKWGKRPGKGKGNDKGKGQGKGQGKGRGKGHGRRKCLKYCKKSKPACYTSYTI